MSNEGFKGFQNEFLKVVAPISIATFGMRAFVESWVNPYSMNNPRAREKLYSYVQGVKGSYATEFPASERTPNLFTF